MITHTTTTRQGRPNWRTGEATEVTEQWTQIEGTCIDITEHRPYEGSHQVALIHHIAADPTVSVKITGQLAKSADGTDRGLPEIGEQVRILARPNPEGSPDAAAATYSASHVTIL